MKITKIIKSLLPKPLIYRYYSCTRNFYSQAGQDFWVYGEVFNFKRNGYFVEIGSYDGLTLNNTFLLESRFNWKGICIEANPVIFNKLIEIRKADCINACIDEKEGKVLFKKNAYASGIVFDTSTINRNESQNDDICELETFTLVRIFRQFQVPSVIDYLSLDIEGSEWNALKNFPFNEYRFNCMTIERPNNDLKLLLAGNGYIIIKEIPGLDVFYIHSTFMESYMENLFKFWKKGNKNGLLRLC